MSVAPDPKSAIGKNGKLSLAQRRNALLLACEYDRLRVRLVCAQLDAEKKLSRTPASSMATAFFKQFPPLDLLRMGALVLPKKQRAMLLLLGTARRLLGKRNK